MDIRQLSYFVAVYEQGSVSAAARQCCVAQPSLSAALRQLEQELGVTLFIRLPKGVTPTEDGEKLYGHAGRLLSQVQSLKASFTEPVARVKFRLGLIRALGVERMSQLLREFSNSVPGLELHLVEPDEPCDARIITPQLLKAGEAFAPIWHDSYLLALMHNPQFGMDKRDITHNINFFMNVPVTPQGGLTFADGISAPGKYVEMKAKMDVIVLISNCPQLNNPCNAYNPTPIEVIVWN